MNEHDNGHHSTITKLPDDVNSAHNRQQKGPVTDFQSVTGPVVFKITAILSHKSTLAAETPDASPLPSPDADAGSYTLILNLLDHNITPS